MAGAGGGDPAGYAAEPFSGPPDATPHLPETRVVREDFAEVQSQASVGRAGGARGEGRGGERGAPGRGAGSKGASPAARRRSRFSLPRAGAAAAAVVSFSWSGDVVVARARPQSLLVFCVSVMIWWPSRQGSAEDASQS